MSQKNIEKKVCPYCDSTYKLVFDIETTSGNPRFCPFCSEEAYAGEEEVFDDSNE